MAASNNVVGSQQQQQVQVHTGCVQLLLLLLLAPAARRHSPPGVEGGSVAGGAAGARSAAGAAAAAAGAGSCCCSCAPCCCCSWGGAALLMDEPLQQCGACGGAAKGLAQAALPKAVAVSMISVCFCSLVVCAAHFRSMQSLLEHLKERGNRHFRAAEWNDACVVYTQGLVEAQAAGLLPPAVGSPEAAVVATLYSNRAAACLKLQRFEQVRLMASRRSAGLHACCVSGGPAGHRQPTRSSLRCGVAAGAACCRPATSVGWAIRGSAPPPARLDAAGRPPAVAALRACEQARRCRSPRGPTTCRPCFSRQIPPGPSPPPARPRISACQTRAN